MLQPAKYFKVPYFSYVEYYDTVNPVRPDACGGIVYDITYPSTEGGNIIIRDIEQVPLHY